MGRKHRTAPALPPQRILDQQPLALVVTDLSGTILYVNRAFTTVTGYAAAEAVGRNPRILKSDQTPQEVHQALWETIVDGRTWRGALLNRKKDGTLYWSHEVIHPLRDTRGRIAHFLSVEEDVTELKSTQDALRESEMRLRAILNSSPDAIINFDEQCRIVEFNPTAERLFGYSRSHALTMNVLQLFPSAARECETLDRPERVMALPISGIPFPAELTVTRVPLEGHPIYTAHLRDLTGEEQIEEQKRILNKRVIRTERMASLGQLAAGVADHLHTLLAPVAALSPLSANGRLTGQALHRHVAELEKAAGKATVLARDLRDIGTPSPQEGKPLDINQVIKNYLQTPEGRLAQSTNPNLSIQLELGSGPLMIAGSARQLMRMLDITIHTAADMMAGSGAIRIRTAREILDSPFGFYERGTQGEYAVITVQDSGRVIQPADLEHLFEPFHATRKMGLQQISGLGLTVLYRIVKDHQGYIDVHPGKDKGNELVIYLPSPQTARARDDQRILDYSGNETVLIVEDYEDQRKAAAEMLERLGYRVISVNNGYSAVRLFETEGLRQGLEKVDIVVIDLVLGDQFDGFETYKRIRELVPAQRAIMVSGFADISRLTEARKLGIGQFVQKPYTMESLGKAVRAELDRDKKR